MSSKFSFDATIIWFLGYLFFVLITPATFNIITFLVPLFSIAIIETVEAWLKIKEGEKE